MSSIREIIRDGGLSVTLSKEKTLTADGRQVSAELRETGAKSQDKGCVV